MPVACTTTGHTVLLIADEWGEILWRVSLRHAELHQLDPTPEGLVLMGSKGKRRLISW